MEEITHNIQTQINSKFRIHNYTRGEPRVGELSINTI